MYIQKKRTLKKLSIYSEKFSRLLAIIEDHTGLEFNPIRLEERIIIREHEELNCMALMGYFGVESVDLIKTIGNYADTDFLTLEDRDKINSRWVKFEDQKIWLDKLNGYLAIGAGSLILILLFLGKIGKRIR